MPLIYYYSSLSLIMIIIMMSASMTSMLYIWLLLEMNMIYFVSMISSWNKYSSDSVIKYFLIQSMSSMVMLVFYLMTPMKMMMSGVLIGVSIKLSMGPFYQWLPSMSEGLQWMNIMLLLTVQKMMGFMLILAMNMKAMDEYLYLSVICLSVLIGSFGGITQLSLRKLMCYSSLNQSGWMLVVLMISDYLWVQFMLLYMIIMQSIIWMFMSEELFYTFELYTKMSMTNKLALFIYMINLSGLPPLSFFFFKLMIIFSASKINSLLMILLIMTSIVSLVFYSRVFIKSLLFGPSFKSMNKQDMYQMHFIGMIMSLPLSMSLN